ncbi:2-hydroxy-3-oxopropionate reductase GarR [Cupriavidus necator]|uniref:2-hydroxy-3-oxopropionate reductase GarR n=1 Tax=Cupriavidus necator TaxID=106590 RepID=A0A1K0JP66_CUPNE|nr:2-hydroxy-3-oxopropionate reductase GarR [Cupriavidus necator]
MKIGYIGLGALGRELARRFLPAHDLCVWDLNPAACKYLASLGASVASSAAEVGRQCDAVLVCLPRSADVHRLVFGPDGLAAGLSPGKLVIDQTSGVPGETRQIAEALARQGVEMLDAAVSASPHVVAEGGATLMASGPDAVYQKALPVLRVISETIVRCGQRVGDGQAMKTVNNAMNACARLGTLEMAALGAKSGLSLAAMSDYLNRGKARNQTTDKMLPALAQGRASTNFALALMVKDVAQAVALGAQAGVPMPITSMTLGLLQAGANALGPHAKLEDMVGVMASLAGTKLEAAPDDAAAGNANPEAPQVLGLLEDAVAALCCLVTFECTAAGLRYGLGLADMATVINRSSGWSEASRTLLPALVSGRQAEQASLRSVIDALRSACALAVSAGAPVMLLQVVRSLAEQGGNQLPDTADVSQLRSVYEAMAGVRYAS